MGDEEVTLDICDAGSDGGLLYTPGWDTSIHWVPRALLFAIALGYTFLGVAIVADIFMGSIERITSGEKEIVVMRDGKKKRMHVRVWNDTVANLTLMALGSSAPEILLSVIELLGNNFKSGELGPSTIVGSAAFNLFVIIAVCVTCIPPDESRAVADIEVFAVTAFFSVFAYIWMIAVLLVWTPDIVTRYEALATFSFFPMFVGLAYAADKNWLPHQRKRMLLGQMVEIEDSNGIRVSKEKLAIIVQGERSPHKVVYKY
jgi:solute carrier family 8 (sodium/calcium exchanger)